LPLRLGRRSPTLPCSPTLPQESWSGKLGTASVSPEELVHALDDIRR